MRNIKTILTLPMLGLSLAAAAQGAGASTSSVDLFQGPNFALALTAVAQLIAIIAAAGILRSLASNTAYFTKFRKMVNENSAKAVLFFAFFAGSAAGAFAQTTEAPTYPTILRDQNFILLLSLNVLLLFVFIYLISLIRRTIAMLMPPAAVAEKAVEKEEAKEESKVMHALTDAVPVEREHEIMMDHEYDGIRELDNNLPPWWVWMFNVTIVFAVVYMIWYHVLPYSDNQHEEYTAELLKAEEERAAYIALRGEMVDETNVEFLADAGDLKAGRSIFLQHCQACHAQDGGGGVGPNLTDPYWIHGGSIQDVFGVIKYGVPTKGMIAWQAQLRPKEMAQVASYIKTLEGTEPAAPKEPQGDLYTAPDASGEVETEDASDAQMEEREESTGEEDDTIDDGADKTSATAVLQ